MANKNCPNCTSPVKANEFFSAVGKASGKFTCRTCGHVLKTDLSLITGLFYFTLMAVFFPIGAILGFSKTPGSGMSNQRVQQIFNVDSDAAFLIGIGILLVMYFSLYISGHIIFSRLKFDEKPDD